MITKIIQIDNDGNVEFIGSSNGDCPIPGLPLGNGHSRRLSHIIPERSGKRMAFLFLRKIFGDRGRVAAWTRTWAGPWRCVILSTGQSEVFDNRQSAVDWEYEIITSPRFDL